MQSLTAISLLGLLPVLFGCQNEATPSCNGPTVISPTLKCNAYYYQTEYDEGLLTTQALFSCIANDGTVGGGNLVPYQNNIEGGIGIEWQSDTEIILYIHPDAVLANDRVLTPNKVQFFEHIITITRKDMPNGHPEYQGCMAVAEH